MRILSVLPLTDSFAVSNAGAASLFIQEIDGNNKKVFVVGSTTNKDVIFKKQYFNIKSINKIPFGSNIDYASKIYKILKKKKFDIIEVHNRPQIALYLKKKLPEKKIVLYFHNDPNKLRASETPEEKKILIENCDSLIFLSNWIRNRFFYNIDFKNTQKAQIIYPGIRVQKKKFPKKEKIIMFSGKLNSAKGYDIFCNLARDFFKINEESSWKFIVAGDEPREKINFDHKNFIKTGWIPNKKVLNFFKKASIVIVPSRWEEPLGRVAIEASNFGAAVITSDKGGLIETSQHSIVIKNLDKNKLLKKILELTSDKKKLLKIQKLNFFQENIRRNIQFSKKKITSIRSNLLSKNININFNNPLKILHVADLHLRHEGRLHYSTVKKLNNGLSRNGYSLQNLSDRDVQSFKKKLRDPKGKNYLNDSLEKFISNFRPDLLIFGHADNISSDKLIKIKKIYPGVRMSQWFLDPLITTGPDYIKNVNRILDKINICDATFATTSPDAIKLNNFKKKNIFYMPNPVDKTIDVLNNYNIKDPTFDIFLAISHGQHRGTLKKGRIDDRLKLIDKIKENNFIKLNLFGESNQPIWGDEFFYNLSLCSMAINLSRGEPIKYYSSDRISSLMGNGLLTFVNKGYQFSDFFKNNKEIVEYINQDDLVEKILFFKENYSERKKIAEAGKKKYFSLFNCEEIAKFIVNKSLGIKHNPKWKYYV